MSPTKVSVIGCGIAGPVLAVLLKLKGYEPVVFERQDEVTATGLSLMCVLTVLLSYAAVLKLEAPDAVKAAAEWPESPLSDPRSCRRHSWRSH